MKRPSLAVNPAALGQFFLNHVEKLGLVIVAAFALLLIWRSIDAVRSRAVGRSRTPEAISSLAAAAEANIENSVARVSAERLQQRHLGRVIDAWRPDRVRLADPPTGAAILNRPLVAELTRRSQPDVFPIEDLQAVAGIAVLPDPRGGPMAADFQPQEQPRERDRDQDRTRGAFGFEGGPADEADPLVAAGPQPRGRITPFVVVTGLIPAARQQAEYRERFATAGYQDPERDTPRWAIYLVERAVVAADGGLNWQKLELENVEHADPGERIGMRPRPGRPGEPTATPLARETLPAAFFLQPGETEIGYAAPLPERIDEPWGLTGLHPWFATQLEALSARAGQAGETGPEAAVPLAELAGRAAGRIGGELRLERVLLDGPRQRQPDLGLTALSVRSADGSTTVAVGPIGQTSEPVFAISDDWAAQLAIEGGIAEAQACNLRVRIDRFEKTPVVRILELELLDAAGGTVATRREPRPAPVEGGEGLGPRAGPGPGGEAPGADNRLFRFVDTKVEPGRRYRYRVRFALRNPNRDLAPRHLADPAAAREAFLVSAMSNETAPVTVPDMTRLLARTIDRETARRMRIKGDALEVMVLAGSGETGNYALRSVVTDLGGLVNVDPALNRGSDTRFFGEQVVTDRILVDARGLQADRSDIRSTDPPEPLELLVLRPDGGFELVKAADSDRTIERYGGTLFKPGTRLPVDRRGGRD